MFTLTKSYYDANGRIHIDLQEYQQLEKSFGVSAALVALALLSKGSPHNPSSVRSAIGMSRTTFWRAKRRLMAAGMWPEKKLKPNHVKQS